MHTPTAARSPRAAATVRSGRRPAWQRTGGLLGLLGLSGLLGLVACQAQTLPRGGPQAEAELLTRIRAEVGEARCDHDAQCRTLPIGEKACGGPASWLAWSTTTGRADRLQAWSTELAALQRQRNEQSGMMSNCQYIADPGVRCVAQRCVLAAGGVGTTGMSPPAAR